MTAFTSTGAITRATAIIIIIISLVAVVGSGFLLSGQDFGSLLPDSSSSLRSHSTIVSSQCSAFLSSELYDGITDTNSTLPYFHSLFGNFSQMTLGEITTVYNSQVATTGSNLSYVVEGNQVINSTQFYEINFTSNQRNVKSSNNASGTIWFPASGSATIVLTNGTRYTGANAASIADDIMYPLELEIGANLSFEIGMASSAFVAESHSTVVLGPTRFNVTTYRLGTSQSGCLTSSSSSSSYPIFRHAVWQVGKVSGMNFYTDTFFSVKISSGISSHSSTSLISVQVLSLTRA